MNLKKSIAALSLAAVMTAGAVAPSFAEAPTKEAIVAQLNDAAALVANGEDEDVRGLYANLSQVSRADTLPAKFDLRDHGVVPAVRSQGSLGTCWSFASIAASEISILSSLGMTADEYREKYGEEIDLSERHLAWFSTIPIAAEEDMTERDAAQVGEGRVVLEDDGSAVTHLGYGGIMGYSSGQFAAGIGPVTEKLVPYSANDGSDSTAADWSVDESLHFAYQWELKDSSILPTPNGRDEDGNYAYNPIAVEMIKQELLAGHAVSFAYNADQAMDPDAQRNQICDVVRSMGAPEEAIALYAVIIDDRSALYTFSEDELRLIVRCDFCYFDHIPYDEIPAEDVDEAVAEILQRASAQADGTEDDAAQEPTEEELQAAAAEAEAVEAAAREAAERLGIDYDEFMEEMSHMVAREKASYMNHETFAHYVYNDNVSPDHAVTIVGYDDTYPATNFLSDHMPPADGAWIVRNSWGDDYGLDGYFYLSYYDRSIAFPETFEFVTDEDSMSANRLSIGEYDFMLAAAVSSADLQTPVYYANEFTVERDSVLTYVSTMTANYDTNVTVAVYLLREDSTSPTDGELLDTRTENFKYAGYHRIALNQHYKLPKGAEISVVQTQRYKNSDGMYYALPYRLGRNCDYSRTYNTLMHNDALRLNEGIEGKVGRNESFVGADGEWFDWVDILDEVKASKVQVNDFVSFDNHSIKIYLYELDDVCGMHNFGDPIPYAGSTLQLCTDCGYSLVNK